MAEQQQRPAYTVTVTLAPGEPATALMRLVSVLHRRGAVIKDLSFRSEDALPVTVMMRIALRNTGWHNLQESLRRLVEVLDVDVRSHPASDQWEPEPSGPALTASPMGSRLVAAGAG